MNSWDWLSVGSALGIAVALGAIAQAAWPPAVTLILMTVVGATLAAVAVIEYVRVSPPASAREDHAERIEDQRERSDA